MRYRYRQAQLPALRGPVVRAMGAPAETSAVVPALGVGAVIAGLAWFFWDDLLLLLALSARKKRRRR